MEKITLKESNWYRANLATLLFLSGLMIGRLFIQIRLYRQGYVSVSADEFARGLRAFNWAQNPRFSPIADLNSAWPPFEKYLNGLMLLVWDNVLLSPRLTVFIFSCLLLVALFYLIGHLFNNLTAMIAVTLVAVQPWTVWLSGTPMLEMYYLACFMGGLYCIIIWLHQERRFYWFYAGLLFFLASGFHVQSWVLINLVNLFTLIFFYQFIHHRIYHKAGQLISFWLVGNAYIIFWSITEYAMTGQLFSILASHTTYSLWFYNGYDVPVREKLLYFPRIVWTNSPLFLWLLAGLGLLFVLRGPERLWRLWPLVLGCLALLWASIFNLASGPPSAAPDRYALLYLLLLSPYVAYGLHRFGEWVWHYKHRHKAYLATSMVVLLFSGALVQGLIQAADFPRGMSRETVETGYYLHKVLADPSLSEPPLQAAETVMVEALYWDFLAIELITRRNKRLLYDREHDRLNRNKPSVFLDDATVVQTHLAQNNVGLVALRDPLLQEQVSTFPFLVRQKEIGPWLIFRHVD